MVSFGSSIAPLDAPFYQTQQVFIVCTHQSKDQGVDVRVPGGWSGPHERELPLLDPPLTLISRDAPRAHRRVSHTRLAVVHPSQLEYQNTSPIQATGIQVELSGFAVQCVSVFHHSNRSYHRVSLFVASTPQRKTPCASHIQCGPCLAQDTSRAEQSSCRIHPVWSQSCAGCTQCGASLVQGAHCGARVVQGAPSVKPVLCRLHPVWSQGCTGCTQSGARLVQSAPSVKPVLWDACRVEMASVRVRRRSVALELAAFDRSACLVHVRDVLLEVEPRRVPLLAQLALQFSSMHHGVHGQAVSATRRNTQ